MSDRACFKAHPIMIAQELKRFLFILIIPLLRGFITAALAGFHDATRGEWIAAWLSGAWLDALALLCLCSICILRWKSFRIGWDEAGFYLKRGIFLHHFVHIPARNAVTVSAVRPLLLRPVGAAILRVDTLAGSHRGFDLRVPIWKDQAESVMKLRGGTARGADTRGQYRPRNLYVAGIAALLSNSVAGLVYVLTAISQLGSLIGSSFSSSLHSGIVFLRSLNAFGLPPLTAIAIYLILLGWTAGFIANFIRHMDLTVISSRGFLKISGGLLTKRDYSIAVHSVSFTDIRQTALGKLIGIMPVLITAVGFGKQKDDLKAVMPLATRRRLESGLELLLPGFIPVKRSLKPSFRSWMRFMMLPMLLCAGVIPVVFCARRFLPIPDLMSPVVPLILLIPALWLGAIRFADLQTGGIGENKRCYTIRFSKGYMLHTVTLQKSRLARFEIRQSIFQRKGKTCDIYIYPYSEYGKPHRLRGLSIEKAQSFISKSIASI